MNIYLSMKNLDGFSPHSGLRAVVNAADHYYVTRYVHSALQRDCQANFDKERVLLATCMFDDVWLPLSSVEEI